MVEVVQLGVVNSPEAVAEAVEVALRRTLRALIPVHMLLPVVVVVELLATLITIAFAIHLAEVVEALEEIGELLAVREVTEPPVLLATAVGEVAVVMLLAEQEHILLGPEQEQDMGVSDNVNL